MARLRRPAIFALLCLLPTLASAQSIFTVAGGGSDDGRSATDVGLYGVRGLALDAKGNIYIAEFYANLIRKVDPQGTITTVAGNSGAGYSGDGQPARHATLQHPMGVAIAPSGDIYIADHDNGRIRKVDAATGIISTVAGIGSDKPDGTIGDNGPATGAVLDGPSGLFLSGANLYVTEDNYNGNRVRKIVLSSGIISTIAGSITGQSGFTGDGAAATAAELDTPEAVLADAAGNIFIADGKNDRVRRIDAATGIIQTVAGGGTPATGTGDGGPATAAKLAFPSALAFDLSGNLLIMQEGGLRSVALGTQIISTISTDIQSNSYGLAVAQNGNILVDDGDYDILSFQPGATEGTIIAGGGYYVGDGLPAPAAVLRGPGGIALDRNGALYIADEFNLLVRKVDPKSGIITTFAGNGNYYNNDPTDNGSPATKVPIGEPGDIAFDAQGNLFVADRGNDLIKRIDANTGIMTYYAGGGNPTGGNDGLPATSAKFDDPVGISIDSRGNLFVADLGLNQVFRIDAQTKIVTLVAGNGTDGYTGDGGPAKSAELSSPLDAIVDSAGNVYIADYGNNAIRKVATDGTISTVAGGNNSLPLGEGGPASQAFVSPTHMTYDPVTGDLYVADDFWARVRRIDGHTGIITTIAGSGSGNDYSQNSGYSGDNGRATDALLDFKFGLSGIAVDALKNVYIADSDNNRVRAVFACVNVAAPQLTAVPNGSASPVLGWSAVSGALRYDVRLDTVTPPARVVASDFTGTSFAPANLAAGTTYYWSVTAKGDPFCPTVSTATSAISTFTTAAGCAVGAFDLSSPANGAQHVPIVPSSSVSLSWQPAAGAVSYDLYLGPNNPPNLAQSGITSTSLNAAVTAGTMFWFVVAHGSCGNQSATSSIRSFSTDLSQFCQTAPNVSIVSPQDGSQAEPATIDLTWSDTSRAVSSFDVYFGTSSSPPLLRSGLAGNAQSVTVSFLDSGTTYSWRVVAHSSCGLSDVSTPVVSFTTQSCTVPGSTQFLFTPSSVSSGATYSVVWSPASGLEADGAYLIERSTSSTFASILDSQESSSTAATFVAGAPGTYYHRVRAVTSCDPNKSGPVSSAASVNVVSAPANIIVTVQPLSVVTALGERIEDHTGSFTLENIGSAPAEIIVGQSELPGSRPFFSIAQGGAFITLQPRVPQTFNIQYSGPPNNVSGSYQGVVFAVGVNQPLPVTPYAFVNLKVGGGPAVAPQFIINGTAGNYAAFPGFAGSDDSNRPALQVSIRNPGTSPMDLSAEVGPEVWLVPDNGWNTPPLAPGETRPVKLFTRRPFAPSGSPLPRYTYFTVRTKDGASARLLVQDNDQIAVINGRATALDSNARSFIVPDAAGRLRLTNNGTDAVQAELIFTPSGADGFDASAVKRAVVVVPPSDVVTLTNPAAQVFGASAGTNGQIEVRVPVERLGLIAVTADAPVVTRGEGARLGAPQEIYLASTAPTTVTLSETTGADHATVSIVAGNQTFSQDVPRYGMKQVSVGSPARITIEVTAGGGSVIGVAAFGNANLISRAMNTSFAKKAGKRGVLNGVTSVTTVVPVISGVTSPGAAPALKTSVALISPSNAANFVANFNSSAGGAVLTKTVLVGGGGVAVVFNDVMHDLFGVSNPPDGNLTIQGPPDGKVYAVLQSAPAGSAPAPASTLPLPTTFSEALTGATGATHRALSLDGLEQSIDPSRGSRWLLLLNEVAGGSGSIDVRLYESGNRSTPIAEKSFNISGNQQVKLDTVFGSLGLESTDRRKDRTNVEVVVTATAGSAQVAASAMSIDNINGSTRVVPLEPAVGSGNPNVSFVAPAVNAPPPSPPRHRAVGH